MFSDLASVEHEIKKTLRHLIIISFINLIKPYTNTIKRFGRPIYRTYPVDWWWNFTVRSTIVYDDTTTIPQNDEELKFSCSHLAKLSIIRNATVDKIAIYQMV